MYDNTTADPYPELRELAGPHAARLIARRHVAAGRHVHLVAEGEITCLPGSCHITTLPLEA